MPLPNRGDYVDALNAIGVDPSGAGFPYAEGIAPVAVMADLSHVQMVPRRMIGHATGSVAGVAGERGTVQLLVRVPTIIRLAAFDGAAGTEASLVTQEGLQFSSGGAGVSAVAPNFSSMPISEARNSLGQGTTTDNFSALNSLRILEHGTFDIPKGDFSYGFYIDAGMRFSMQMVNTASTFEGWIVWEEQTGRVP